MRKIDRLAMLPELAGPAAGVAAVNAPDVLLIEKGRIWFEVVLAKSSGSGFVHTGTFAGPPQMMVCCGVGHPASARHRATQERSTYQEVSTLNLSGAPRAGVSTESSR